MFCKNCGKEVPDNVLTCQNCGASVNPELDKGNIGFLCLGFCIPVAGIILYFVWREQKPKSAKKCLIGFLINITLAVVIYAIYFVLIALGLSLGIY